MIKNNTQAGRLIDHIDEQWKGLVGVVPNLHGYEVSSAGRIKSLERMVLHPKGGLRKVKERILKIYTPIGRYPIIAASKSRGCFLVHRLVAKAFIPNPLNYDCVNHIDGDKTNANYKNLEWCTYSQNENHSYKVLGKKPTKNMLGKTGFKSNGFKPVGELDANGNVMAVWESASIASKIIKISQGTLSMVCRGERAKTKNRVFTYLTLDEFNFFNAGYTIDKKRIEITNRFGEKAHVTEYSLKVAA